MSKVIFDYTLSFSEIKQNVINFDVKNININQLKSIANGKIFIFFKPNKEHIILEVGIIDYLIQLKNIILEIESGNHNPFSVSCDWYSNSLAFTYNQKSDSLIIKEVNSELFLITTKYKLFKTSFEKFYKRVLNDIQGFYPDLDFNTEFKKLI